MIKPLRLLILSVIICCSLAANAQLLNHTRWKSFDQLNNFDLFWNFDNGLVAFSTDNINWDFNAVYTEAGNVFTIRDVNPLMCDTTVYGIYHFSIVQDTLRFTLLADNCVTRSDYFTTYYFVDFPIGIIEPEQYKNISVYPVPFGESLNIKTETGAFDFCLRDITGRIVKAISFSGTLSIETENLELGIYLYELRVSGKLVKCGKAVKN
jgi:hypothetical protein